jgi:hypothetical protein
MTAIRRSFALVLAAGLFFAATTCHCAAMLTHDSGDAHTHAQHGHDSNPAPRADCHSERGMAACIHDVTGSATSPAQIAAYPDPQLVDPLALAVQANAVSALLSSCMATRPPDYSIVRSADTPVRRHDRLLN